MEPQPSFRKGQIPKRLIDVHPLLVCELTLAMFSTRFFASAQECILIFVVSHLFFNSTSFFGMKNKLLHTYLLHEISVVKYCV